MLIPKYWAQYKQRFESQATANRSSKQATIKRYGWSDISQSEALNHARTRVTEAHNRWLAGEDIVCRERKEEYNASNGIPIREQVITEQTFPSSNLSDSSSYQTQVITTRNSYGAQVANVDNIAIIDVDNDELLHYNYPDSYDSHGYMTALISNQSQPSSKLKVWFFVLVFIFIASVIAWLGLSWLWLLVVMIGVTAYLWQQASQRDKARAQKYADDIASLLPYMTERLQKRVVKHPKERFRLYETPAGFRIIATHDTIAPSDELVAEWFEYFHADANYVRLCQAQQCFRARLTAKPWRMAEVNEQRMLEKSIPAKEFWFADDGSTQSSYDNAQQAALTARKQWVADYESFAKGYRACRYIESFKGREVGNSEPAPAAISDFIEWHDRVCQVEKELVMA